jgi:lipoprotein-anchoring transpeptidase ErfK/SrfK
LAACLAASLALAAGSAAVDTRARQKQEFERTLRLQVLLDRAHFSPGEIDGAMGDNTRRALAGYRRARIADATLGEDALLDSLAELDPLPPLVDYTIATADVAGPFAAIPEDMMEKAQLPALPFSSPLEGLGEKFHASPRLLRRLNPDSRFEAGEVIRVPNVERSALAAAARLVVSVSDRSVSALDARGRVLARYPATMGSAFDPLPLGAWKVNGVRRDPWFFYNPDLFWDADPAHAKAKLPPGPNSPVGVVWIDLSKESLGIHGTPEPSRVGKSQSHGCIRLTNWDAAELAAMVAPGVPAILTE